MLRAVAVAVLLFVATTSVSVTVNAQATDNLVQLAQKLNLTTLVSLVTKAGLADTLAKSDLTVFAPSDAAFARLPKAVLDELSKNNTLLKDVLTYHLVNGTVKSTDLKNDLLAPSLFADHGIRINFIYLGGMTVTAQGKQVLSPDNMATNGVIHVVDDVLYPIPEKTVTGLVSADASLSTLLTAVTKANLAITLNGAGPFTVFAPTNDAFAALPKDLVDKLLGNVTALTAVLKYHVLSGTVFSSGIGDYQNVPTLEGEPVLIYRINGQVRVDRAQVIKADVPVTNGVAHVINALLIPDGVFRWLAGP